MPTAEHGGPSDHSLGRFREATLADVPGILAAQEPAAIAALGHIFPQGEHPFPRAVVEARWRSEIAGSDVVAYVSLDQKGAVTGFAARQQDELLHFGTAIEYWGTGLAQRLHEALASTFPQSLNVLRLRVFEENARARRFYERLGWAPTGATSRTLFAPFPVLLEYALGRASGQPSAG